MSRSTAQFAGEQLDQQFYNIGACSCRRSIHIQTLLPGSLCRSWPGCGRALHQHMASHETSRKAPHAVPAWQVCYRLSFLHPNPSAGVRAAFLAYVQREAPDKQAALAEFQQKFNAVDIDLRSSAETRAELLLRCDELRDALWDKCDRRNAESEQQLQRVRWGAGLRRLFSWCCCSARSAWGSRARSSCRRQLGCSAQRRPAHSCFLAPASLPPLVIAGQGDTHCLFCG